MIKIVLVDDHQMFLDGMIAVLSQEENMQILFVENSAKVALKKIKIEVPDLVITDISMPDMNGLEFVKILKKDFPEIKILVLSMFENIQSSEGIDGYLLKETDKITLIKAVNGIVLKDEKHFVAENQKNSLDFNKSILSPREKDIIQLIAQEYTTEQIAEKLFLSKNTIDTHRKNIFFKLDVKNIAGLVKKAFYLGILR
jgi:DNA-binding NarL/FixJ family response regulator